MRKYFIFTFQVIFIALEDKVVALTSSGAFRGAKILMKDRGKINLTENSNTTSANIAHTQ